MVYNYEDNQNEDGCPDYSERWGLHHAKGHFLTSCIMEKMFTTCSCSMPFVESKWLTCLWQLKGLTFHDPQ